MSDIIKKESIPLDTPIEDLEHQLLTENNIDRLNEIIDIFNLNIKRKDIVRTSKLNELQDKVTSQMALRLEKNAGEFSNKDLLDYFKTLQETISKADNSLESVNTPAIQINQQQINIGTESAELTRESRDKVKKIIDQILADSKNQSDIIDIVDTIEIKDSEDN